MNDESQDALRRLLDRTLQELPQRRAPATLELRVLGELERRAALPWWRRSFGHWPLAARAAFVVLCGVLIRLAFIGGAMAIDAIRSLSWAHDALAVIGWAADLAAVVAHFAPPAWAYEIIALCAALYAILFGLGAFGYRSLYLQSTAGD
jgi:hypothetical protein